MHPFLKYVIVSLAFSYMPILDTMNCVCQGVKLKKKKKKIQTPNCVLSLGLLIASMTPNGGCSDSVRLAERVRTISFFFAFPLISLKPFQRAASVNCA